MAERRMFTKKVTDDDNFMQLSASAQALYLHLSMAADDDGFCNQVSISMFKAHASVQDLKALLEARYIYQFENGVIVIKHWRMANALRKDRYTPTAFKEELARLQVKDNGSYTLAPVGCQLVANGLPDGYQEVAVCLPQDRLGKDSIGKVSIEEGRKADKPPRAPAFKPPTVEEVAAYCQERQNGIDPQAFVDFYAASEWKRGNTKIKDWKACVRTWERRDRETPPKERKPRKQYTTADTYKPPKPTSADAIWNAVDEI